MGRMVLFLEVPKSSLMVLKVRSCLWLCHQVSDINPVVHMVLSLSQSQILWFSRLNLFLS